MTKKETSRLIVLEGPDGVGKTTLAHAIMSQLRAAGRPAECFSLPGRRAGTLGAHVYRLHHQPQDANIISINEASLQLLHLAAHVDALTNEIIPAIERKAWVVLDRFWWSAIVYGRAAGVGEAVVRGLRDISRYYWAPLRPALMILMLWAEPGNDDRTCLQKGPKSGGRLENEYLRLLEEERDEISDVSVVQRSSFGVEAEERILAQVTNLQRPR